MYKNKGNSNTNITIKEGTESISPGAFRNCTSLRTVNMPSSVGKIGSEAFYGCSSLRTIDFNEEFIIDEETGCFGYSMIEIGYGAFHGCKSLDSRTSAHIVVECINEEDLDTLFEDTFEQLLEDFDLF